MKSNNRYLFILFSVLIISLYGCKEETSPNKKENKQEVEKTVERKTKEQRYATHVAEIHKSSHYKNEEFVGFELDVQLPKLKDQVKVIKSTDFSQIHFSSKKHGDFYLIGNEIFSTEDSQINAKTARVYLDLAFVFGAFSQIYEAGSQFGEIQEKEAFDQQFKLMRIQNITTDYYFAPKELTSWTDARTDMLKAVAMNFSLTEKEHLFYFDRYITVNRVPVSLTWKVFDAKKEKSLDQANGEVKVSRIKYYAKGEYTIQLPEELNEVELLDLVQ